MSILGLTYPWILGDNLVSDVAEEFGVFVGNGSCSDAFGMDSGPWQSYQCEMHVSL